MSTKRKDIRPKCCPTHDNEKVLTTKGEKTKIPSKEEEGGGEEAETQTNPTRLNKNQSREERVAMGGEGPGKVLDIWYGERKRQTLTSPKTRGVFAKEKRKVGAVKKTSIAEWDPPRSSVKPGSRAA